MTNNLSCKILIEVVGEVIKYSGNSPTCRRLTAGRERNRCKVKYKGLKILKRIDKERAKKNKE